MHSWMGAGVFLQTVVRVAIVWAAFYGTGRLLAERTGFRKLFPLVPNEIAGMIALFLLTIPLSLLGILNRTVSSVLTILLAFPGLMLAYGAIKDRLRRSRPTIPDLILTVVLLLVLLLSFTHSSMTNLAFDDPLVTYAVQPDRWLNDGGIRWYDDTTFSGFPMFYEMSAVWPAALSSDRLNQLSVLQVFQMSLLLVAVVRGASILGIKRRIRLPLYIVVMFTTALYIWCSMAKTDTMALLLCTLALTSAIRQRSADFAGSPLSSWLMMGLLLATKQTAVIVLIPFFLYSLGKIGKYSRKYRALALVSMALLPGCFALRTMARTGSPTYPMMPVRSMLMEDWKLNQPEENITVNRRASLLYEHKAFSIPKAVGIFFWYMEGNILLLLAGAVTVAFMGKWRDLGLILPFFAYCVAGILAFWPTWWGSKYTILIYPFAALLGAHLLGRSSRGWITASLVALAAIIVPGFIFVSGDPRPLDYRITVLKAVLGGEWDVSTIYRIPMSTPEGMTQMWANSAFPEQTVIFSLHEEKRYFFNGRVIVGWRHPVGQRLYLNNKLEDEVAVLDELEVDLVGFYRSDPVVMDQEDRLEILEHIGTGDILEPLIIVDGNYLLCRYNSPSIR